MDVGEAAAFSLLEEMEADIILTDDGELIKLCKRHNIPFICAMAIVIKRKMKAIELYKERKVSLGLAARMAGLPLPDFFDLLREHKVKININLDDAKDALKYAEEKL